MEAEARIVTQRIATTAVMTNQVTSLGAYATASHQITKVAMDRDRLMRTSISELMSE